MRVAVVGATGNVGTAVLKALGRTPEVSSVLGIARRMPDTSVEPYSGCEWLAIDIAAATSEADAVSQLSSAFVGADAVVHLAWLVQPSSHRELLRRVNVEGTARVARAVAEAHVPHFIVASSVSAYSPSEGQAARTEDWSVDGIPTSHYSVDKVAQERVLDNFSVTHPDIVVTRMRPALTFQPDAASEIQRYLLSRRTPVCALTSVRLPFLAVPKGMRGIQAVHSDDVGRAYAAAVVKRASGAFNICADGILSTKQLADIIHHGRYVELPRRFVRASLFVAHRAKLVAADEGWIDMLLAAPMMDNSRAKTELSWEPLYTAEEALLSLLRGMKEGRVTGSIPLRPRVPDRAFAMPTPWRAASGDNTDDVSSSSPVSQDRGDQTHAEMDISDMMDLGLFGLYLSDHLTGATAGGERAKRMAAAYVDTPVYARLSELAEQLRLERTVLRNLIHDLGVRRRRYRQAVAWVGERAGRLKGNGRVLSRSPMTLVLESELMRGAVMGKLGLWQTLEANALELGYDPLVFADLSTQTRRQVSVLDEVHEYARHRAFRQARSRESW